jgi:hypothetical protein
VLTVERRLKYYTDPAEFNEGKEPRGWLGTHFTCFTGTTVQILTQKALAACLGMEIKQREATEKIEGNECFTFTLQAKEGSRKEVRQLA